MQFDTSVMLAQYVIAMQQDYLPTVSTVNTVLLLRGMWRQKEERDIFKKGEGRGGGGRKWE